MVCPLTHPVGYIPGREDDRLAERASWELRPGTGSGEGKISPGWPGIDEVDRPSIGSNMPAFTHHIFVCGNVRDAGHKRGCCDPDGRQVLRDAFKKELKKAGFGALARANHAGCLEQCEHGPTVVIYPQGIWYGRVRMEDVPRIVTRTILGGEILNDLLIVDDCLNNPDCPHRRGPAEGEPRG
jgi:(2Fe-2S) ferredoxin